MMPSIRLVLFALTHDSIGLLSDSMRLSIDQDLNCGLQLSYKSKAASQIGSANTVRPNDVGQLEISARPGDVVSIIGIDKATYSLNNRTRLESSRIIERVKRLDPGCGFGGGRNNLDVFHNAGLMLFKDPASIGPQGAPIGTSCFSFSHHFKYVEDTLMGFSKPMLAQLGKQRDQSNRRSRSKREIDAETIIENYTDPLHKACCRLGTLEDEPQRRSCEARKRIVEKYTRDSGRCSATYYECCRRVFDQGSQLKLGFMVPGLAEPEISARSERPLGHSPGRPSVGQLDQLEAQTLVRRDFRETWLFEAANVDENGRSLLDVQLPHSITGWSISAVALSRRDMPMCLMAQPLLVQAFQEVFVHVSMPYKVVQGEQIDLVATLFNYSPTSQDMLVYMYGVEDVCSEAEPDERSEPRRVSIERHSSQALIFTMIPLRTGSHPIKIVAITSSSNASDIVERRLEVVPRGRAVTDETTFSLDPMNQQRRSKRAIQTGNLVDEIDSQRGLQRSRVRLAPSRESEYIVPQTQECIVSAIGDKMGQTVQTTILDVENLIRLPHGCGEQVMIYLGPTLYTARYLAAIGKLTGDMRWRANRYIQSGYKRVLNFRNENGGFSAFAGRGPSVWLTAFIAKLLCQTERTPFVADEVHVDRTVVQSALSWLIDRQNVKTGTWIEWNPVYHREMLGGVVKENGLTAFVAITLNECAHHSPEIVDEVQIDQTGALDRTSASPDRAAHVEVTNGWAKLKLATQRAEETLILDRYRALKEKNAYVLSLVAYSLSLTRPREAVPVLADLWSLADRSAARNHLFWRGDHQIETAAYALQALIELAPLITAPSSPEAQLIKETANTRASWLAGADAVAIANWLSSRRSYTGAFESTQDTVVALEALSKFAQLQPTPNGGGLIPQAANEMPNLYCNVTINNRTRRSIEFGKDNAQILQTFKLDSFDLDPVSGETLDITTSGNGLGIMTVKLKYNVFQDEDELCRFSIDSSIEEWRPKVNLATSEPAGESRHFGDGKRPVNVTSDEDDFFRTFDKSMLNELNLIDLNQNEPLAGEQQQAAAKEARDKSAQTQYLRLRRSAASPASSAASLRDASEDDGWTSKLVAGIRSRLPAWIGPKSAGMTTTTTTTTTTTSAPSIEKAIAMASIARVPEISRRNSTYRRSAQATGPLFAPPSGGIPADAHLNMLSNQLEITSQNRSASSNVTQQIIDNPSRRLVLLLRVCAHHLSAVRDSEMAVIEVGILSGFKPNEADLRAIINDVGTPAMKYELSGDRSMVMLYLEHIPNSGPFCFQFRLVRSSLVYNLQSGFIRVYEYYSPAHSCSNFYTPTRISNLLETKCDASGEVCQCAVKSLCPATSKLISLSASHEDNSTSARNELIELVCKNKYDLVALIKLKSVRFHEAARTLRLSVKVMADLRGNLTRIVEAQRQQRAQLIDKVRKPQHSIVNIAGAAPLTDQNNNNNNGNNSSMGEDEGSLDYLHLTIDPGCLRDDPLLLHMAHPSQQKHAGEQMVLFARSKRLERRYFRATQKTTIQNGRRSRVSAAIMTPGPRPKANVLVGSDSQKNDQGWSPFEDAQSFQYSLNLPLDRDSILHDISYQARLSHREALNSLILWLELRSKRERWTCAGF